MAAKKKATKKSKKKSKKKPEEEVIDINRDDLVGKDLSNNDLAQVLKEMGLRHQMDGIAFKPQAYERAAWSVGALDRPLVDLYVEGGLKAIQKVDSVGKGIAQRLEELIKTGVMADLEAMRKDFPVDIFGLMAIEGIGAKKVKKLYEGLGVTNVEQLAEAARAERVRELPGFGEKSEQQILRHVELLSQTQGRWPIGEVRDIAIGIQDDLLALPYVEKACVAGSMRRFRETIGDIDILVVSPQHEKVMDYFAELPGVAEVFSKGETKTMVRLAVGLDADCRVVDKESFGAALLYFTGSKHHNIVLRQIAIKLGYKLNEYGIFEIDEETEEEKNLGGETEEAVYGLLGLPYIPPEIREDTGEIEAAKEGRVPVLLEASDLRGDAHVQTSRGRGEHSLLEMARAARERGLDYLVVGDVGDPDALKEQRKEIEKVESEIDGFRVLQCAVVPIDEAGEPQLQKGTESDFVAVYVDSAFLLPRAEQTKRMIHAIEHPQVDFVFHPTARVFKHQEPIDIDIEDVVSAAASAGTVLEINGQPERLDLKDDHVRAAVDAGAKLVVTSNARSTVALRYLTDFGVFLARRGWCTAEHVLNTLDAEAFLEAVKR